MFTRQHYEAIAGIFAKTIDPGDRTDKISPNEYTYAVLESMGDDLADYFAKDNPRFDRKKFLEACGL